MGTSTNWEKKWKTWFTEKFIKECAAYAVATDMSSGAVLEPGGKAVEYETRFEIPDPALTKEHKEGAPPTPGDVGIGAPVTPTSVVQKLTDAFRTAGGRLDASAVEAAVERGAAEPGYAAKTPMEQRDAVWKYMFRHGWGPGEESAGGGGNSRRGATQFNLLKNVLETLLDPDFGRAGPWMVGPKYKMWDLARNVSPEHFDIVLSSIIDRDGAGFDKIFAPLREAGRMPSNPRTKYLPLVYSAPMRTADVGHMVTWGERAAWEEEVKAMTITDQVFTTAFQEAFEYTYLLAGPHSALGLDLLAPTPIVVGHPFKFVNIVSNQSLPLQADVYSEAWTPQAQWPATSLRIAGRNTQSLYHWLTITQQALGPASALTTGHSVPFVKAAWSQLGGVTSVDPLQFWSMFRNLVQEIGRCDWKTSTGKSWYDQIIYEILWGVQDPTPPGPTRPHTGGSGSRFAPKPRPKNVGKRKLEPGEIHAVDLQCYLLENITKLAYAREVTPYKNVGVIRGAQPGNIVSKLNHGAPPAGQGAQWPPTAGGPDSEAYTLQNMCPDLWAMMVPHLELYRVTYLTGPDGQTLLTPGPEHKIPFSNFFDPKDVQLITAPSPKYGRQAGAGIKSFTWSLDGTQPAEVDNMISAQLTMHFQSVYDLFRHNEHPDRPDEYAAGIPNQPGYLDLIIGSGTQGRPQSETANSSKEGSEVGICEGVRSNVYDGENFRIKVIAGWSTPPGFATMNIPGYSTDDLKHIQAALDASRTLLYLQIVSHAINFQQDGSLELVIDYQASMSGITRSPKADIFIGKEVNEAAQQFADLLEEDLAALDAAATAALDTNENFNLTEHEEKRQLILNQQIAIMRKSRAEKYKEFLRSLKEHNKVRGWLVNTKDLNNPLYKIKDPLKRADAAKSRDGAEARLASAAATAPVATRTMGELVGLANTLGTVVKEEENEDLKRLSDDVGIFKSTPKKTLVPFMYLGDLIDAILKSRLPHLIEKDASGSPPLQFMLGNVEMIDPLAAYQIRNVVVACPTATNPNATASLALSQIDPFRFRKITGIWTSISIGSIPISLDKFNEWFVTTIIKEKVDSYPLLNFIRDMCSSLIGGAYSSSCFEEMFKFHLSFNTSNFRMADSYRGKTPTLDDMARSARTASENDRKRRSGEEDKPPSIPTSVLYSVDSRPMKGDRISDMQEGVYHYFLGGRCGLTKEIVFERQDMPGYREARISKDGSLGAQQLKELYTVNMSMVGNTLHKNGTFVYIDPIAIGAGSARATGGIPNIARLIGLGGYFLVTSVSSQIGPDGFSTQVSAMQQQSALDDSDRDRIVALNAAPECDANAVPDADPEIEAAAAATRAELGCAAGDVGGGSDTDPGPDNIAGDDTGTVIAATKEFQAEAPILSDAERLPLYDAFERRGTADFTDEDQAAIDAYQTALDEAGEGT